MPLIEIEICKFCEQELFQGDHDDCCRECAAGLED